MLRNMCNSTYFHPRPKLSRKVMSYLRIFTANLTYFATKKHSVSSAWHIHRIRGPSCGCRQWVQTMAQPTISLHSRVFHDRQDMARWPRHRTRGRCIETASVNPRPWRSTHKSLAACFLFGLLPQEALDLTVSKLIPRLHEPSLSPLCSVRFDEGADKKRMSPWSLSVRRRERYARRHIE